MITRDRAREEVKTRRLEGLKKSSFWSNGRGRQKNNEREEKRKMQKNHIPESLRLGKGRKGRKAGKGAEGKLFLFSPSKKGENLPRTENS